MLVDMDAIARQYNGGTIGYAPTHRARFKHTIPVFERSKTMHKLDRAATGTGTLQ